ncbi:Plant transposase (Ptta/En/Spm family) [Carex littledalei]|uniref:Plant transposase (Ptta/En/Spm family) n=1 Tax=Carex littledalei TaxID=544730 RepID=A0A833R5G6_9POAL|nr:Plant transposase (Ptta/En/Spm family) [Carex littledalei]
MEGGGQIGSRTLPFSTLPKTDQFSLPDLFQIGASPHRSASRRSFEKEDDAAPRSFVYRNQNFQTLEADFYKKITRTLPFSTVTKTHQFSLPDLFQIGASPHRSASRRRFEKEDDAAPRSFVYRNQNFQTLAPASLHRDVLFPLFRMASGDDISKYALVHRRKSPRLNQVQEPPQDDPLSLETPVGTLPPSPPQGNEVPVHTAAADLSPDPLGSTHPVSLPPAVSGDTVQTTVDVCLHHCEPPHKKKPRGRTKEEIRRSARLNPAFRILHPPVQRKEPLATVHEVDDTPQSPPVEPDEDAHQLSPRPMEADPLPSLTAQTAAEKAPPTEPDLAATQSHPVEPSPIAQSDPENSPLAEPYQAAPQPPPEADDQAPLRSATDSSKCRTFTGRNPRRAGLRSDQSCSTGNSDVPPLSTLDAGSSRAPTEVATDWDAWESNPRSPIRHPSHSPARFESPSAQATPEPSLSDQRARTVLEDDASGEQYTEDESSPHPAILDDDGSRRCLRRRPLTGIPEALDACGLELDESAAQASAVERKRKRSKRKCNERCGRGLAMPRAPVPPEDRPELAVVGDAEFTSSPRCTKIITTLRLLTLWNLPGPYRSWNMFPSTTRLFILKQFLQRYSWGAEQDTVRCIEVFERVAAETYMRELGETRRWLTRKFGDEKEVWIDHPPKWCKNLEYWKGLCIIWSKDKFVTASATNRTNRIKGGQEVVHHVGGSRSSYRHKEVLISEKGSPVGPKEVFDRTHMRDTPQGKKYVNENAEKAALLSRTYLPQNALQKSLKEFLELKAFYGDTMDDEEIWEMAVNGEDKRGRLFGFGFKSRTSKLTRVLETVEGAPSEPTKSTATSAEDSKRKYTKEEVAELLRAERTSFVAERTSFVAELAAQEQRHRADMEEIKKNSQFTRDCFAELFRKQGLEPPKFPLAASQSNSQFKRSAQSPLLTRRAPTELHVPDLSTLFLSFELFLSKSALSLGALPLEVQDLSTLAEIQDLFPFSTTSKSRGSRSSFDLSSHSRRYSSPAQK